MNTEIYMELSSVSFIHNKKKLLDSISLEFSGAQLISFLGPNGAGKSTLLKIIGQQLFPSNGSVRVHSKKQSCNKNKISIGYMPEISCLLPELKVSEYLEYAAYNKGILNYKYVVKQVSDACQINGVMDLKTNSLSMGYKQRLNLAQALLNDPDVLILDEPLNGLDPMLIKEFRGLLKKLKIQKLILMSTHYLAEAEMVSDQVVIMNSGKIIKIVNNLNNLESSYIQAFEEPSL